jgi:hypothetical protein
MSFIERFTIPDLSKNNIAYLRHARTVDDTVFINIKPLRGYRTGHCSGTFAPEERHVVLLPVHVKYHIKKEVAEKATSFYTCNFRFIQSPAFW